MNKLCGYKTEEEIVVVDDYLEEEKQDMRDETRSTELELEVCITCLKLTRSIMRGKLKASMDDILACFDEEYFAQIIKGMREDIEEME